MTVKEIINKVRENEDLVDAEKADFLYYFSHLFSKECEKYQDEIDDMIENYD